MPDNAIVIPIYKDVPDKMEKFSLSLGLKMLKEHPVIFICPENLDTSYYQHVCNRRNIVPLFVRFPANAFTSVSSYNRLMLTPDFYSYFLEYEFILIYQLDALIFSDQLALWCRKGYDYLGAPVFLDPETPGSEPVMQEKCCNGGFSLRRVQATYDLLQSAASFSFSSLKHQDYAAQGRYIKAFLANFKSRKPILEVIVEKNMQEDIALAHYLPRFFPDYKVAAADIALYFSFEEYPEKLYEYSQGVLPLGCHAFEKYNFNFWIERLKELGEWEWQPAD